jgi:DNA-binding CsgD family transcriptional regulator
MPAPAVEEKRPHTAYHRAADAASRLKSTKGRRVVAAVPISTLVFEVKLQHCRKREMPPSRAIQSGPARDALSLRQLEVVKLIADGLSSKQIATQLGLRTKTVTFYRAKITQRLGIKSTAGVVRWAIRNDVIEAWPRWELLPQMCGGSKPALRIARKLSRRPCALVFESRKLPQARQNSHPSFR